MLLRFTVSNHRSIFDPVELSMIAIDDDRAATRGFDQLPERVLTVAGIYGANASGKSNVLDAIAWLSRAVNDSLRHWQDNIPREPHLFGDGPRTPSSFSIEFMADGVRYDYSLEVDDTRVLTESLHSYPARRRRVLFTRDGETVEFRRGTTRQGAIKELLTPTSLALSVARRLGHEDFLSSADFVARVGAWGLIHGSPLGHPMSRRPGGTYIGTRNATERIFDTELHSQQQRLFPVPDNRAEQREVALALLQFADLGIEDVTFEEEDTEGMARPRRRPKLVHRGEAEAVPFEFKDESAGTVVWFRLIGPVLAALREGWLLLVDEVDASLHPQLSARLLELFHDPETNPIGAQLVFTTHDTSLLGVLNRDEVWLTEKDQNGTTSLTALADFGGERVRKSVNLERAYLQGRFGGLPDLDQHRLKQALTGAT